MKVDALRGVPTSITGRATLAWLQQVRLRDWVHFLPLPLATFEPNGDGGATLSAAARGVASAFAILAFGYLLNSLADRRMDLDVRKNPLIAAREGTHRFSLALLLCISLLLAVVSPWPAQLAIVSCLSFACVYSMGPRIKSIPFVGSLANLGNFGPLLFVGMQNTSLPPRFAGVVLTFASLLLQNQLIHEAGDALEDRGGGVRTTWLTLGPRRTSVLAACLGLGAAVAAAYMVPAERSTQVAMMVGTVFGAAFPVALASTGAAADRAARLRIAHRWCALLFGAGLFVAWRWAM